MMCLLWIKTFPTFLYFVYLHITSSEGSRNYEKGSSDPEFFYNKKVFFAYFWQNFMRNLQNFRTETGSILRTLLWICHYGLFLGTKMLKNICNERTSLTELIIKYLYNSCYLYLIKIMNFILQEPHNKTRTCWINL